MGVCPDKGQGEKKWIGDKKKPSGLNQIIFQTMYAGKYMNMYGLPAAGGTEQVRQYFKQTSSVDDAWT